MAAAKGKATAIEDKQPTSSDDGVGARLGIIVNWNERSTRRQTRKLINQKILR